MQELIPLALLVAIAAILALAAQLRSSNGTLDRLRRDHQVELNNLRQQVDINNLRQHVDTDNLRREDRDKIEELQQKLSEAEQFRERRARELFDQWRVSEIGTVRREQQDNARSLAGAELEKWKATEESRIRSDAIAKSQAVISGKATEHLVPFLPDFRFNPKDARFIGSPVDFIVFDGHAEGAVRNVIFLEVKTGSSVLSPIERQVRDAVEAKRVAWEEVRVRLSRPGNAADAVPNALQAPVPHRQASSARVTAGTRNDLTVRSADGRIVYTQTVRRSCSRCGKEYVVTLKRGEQTGYCAHCSHFEVYDVSWE